MEGKTIGEMVAEAERITILRIYSTPISEFGISAHTKNALKRQDITIVGQLCCIPRSELKRFPGIGKKAIQEIDAFMGKAHLSYCDFPFFISTFTKHF